MPETQESRLVYRSPTVAVTEFRCRPRDGGCGPDEQSTGNQVVFLRRGLFVKHLGRERIVADANHVLFFNHDHGYRVSHPVDGGDDCTVFTLSPAVLREVLRAHDPRADERRQGPFTFDHCPTGPRAHLFHRTVLVAASGGSEPDLALDELIVRLLAQVIGDAYRRRRGNRPARRQATTAAHRDLAVAVQTTLARRFSGALPLADLAREVHSSPFHLCRVFQDQVGQPIQKYRNRLRLRASLEELAANDRDTTELALDLGYSSRGHFSDAFRREFSMSPSAFRRMATGHSIRETSKILGA
ncbi:MAG: helix-turn-helix domain-containing protein [Planctomycetota bacterium]|jgi:AraC-like DNA-binding protein